MNILLAHNYYGSGVPSGENKVFEAECKLLRQHGHEVAEFVRHSDVIRAKGAWGTILGALSAPWNPFAAKSIREKVDTILPDVVNVHNTFPLLSPSIFHAIGDRAARVLTLHNYRLFCPAAIPMRAGTVCTDCLDRRSIMPSLLHGCYRGSRLATAPLAINVALHRFLGTWTEQVDAFVVLSEFQREQMIEAGLPVELVHVKPNFYPGNPEVVPWRQRREAVVFAGRLGSEKGVKALVSAWRMWGAAAPELRIAGDGELRNKLMHMAAAAPNVKITFLGQMTGAQAQEEIALSKFIVLPSESFEGFPMVLQEAFAFGTPAAVADIGPLPSIVKDGQNGVVFQPRNPESLLETVRSAWNDRDKLERLAGGARGSFETLYNEDANYDILMNIYDRAIQVCERRRGRTR